MSLLLGLIIALNFICITFARDPSPLQDLCVADFKSTVRVKGLTCKDPENVTAGNIPFIVNGLPCKDPKTITVKDFLYKGFHQPGNKFGETAFKTVDVTTIPGLNTQGLSLLRFDLLSRNSSIPPHSHPRASEVIWVEQGSVEAGFVSGSKQYNINLNVGDVYVFPNALVHYFRNIASGKSIVMAVFNSQNPGYVAVTQTIYGA